MVFWHLSPELGQGIGGLGAQEALGNIAILAAIHGLLQPSFATFMQMLSAPGSKGLFPQHASDATVLPLAATADTNAPPPMPEAASSSAQAIDPPETAQGQSQEFAKKNAQDRGTASQWIHTDPLADLIAMAAIIDPFSQLMHSQLAQSSFAWEEQQQANQARAMSANQQHQPQRQYSLVEAAKGTLENRFHQQVAAVFKDKELWSIVPDSACTSRWRTNAFKVLSRGAAAVHQLISVPHQGFPYQTFLLLEDPAKSATIAAQPVCLKDGFTRSLASQWTGLDSPQVRAVLEAMATKQPLDISGVEARHASIRRQLHSKSVQTWAMGVTSASGEWVLQQFRNKMHRSSSGAKSSVISGHEGSLWRRQKVCIAQVYERDTTETPTTSGPGNSSALS